MGLNLYLPGVTKEKATVKDYSVQILSQEWPLTTKKIFHLIKKRFGVDCTYQAVFKSLRELLDTGVIERNEAGYQINLKWLKHVHSFTETTETNYFTKNRMSLIDGIKDSKKEGDISILTFETLFDVEKYLYYLQKDIITKSQKPQAICYHHNHEWRPIYYTRAEYNWIRKLGEMGHSCYVLCAGNTASDKHAARFYRSIGCSVRLGANCASTCELMVTGDLVIEIYIPHDILESMHREFMKIKNVSQTKAERLAEEIFEKRQDIQVIIKNDRNIAEQIRKYTMGLFKN